ncbi:MULTISPECIES: MmcQ/YjbR family DNA-binding protein [Paeniglutamicibacter]|uniref:DNA-binding protein (MmcQ/YjbR family) n=1 Tax=Paeniglutamicibacter sulfureus TaxID=43666 RepID=A0ABU2BHP9_9MICC|nr:MmcQ/YjbR family DNA-binding protein [Paeniglutamicibacter sulfureus]MDR7358175.1 putative DNA-binding protein (MmcQ/YjbR family) [Paeniglutamicibacter sulfureus]
MEYESWRGMLLSMPGAFEDFPFGEDAAVFKVAGKQGGRAKMFGLLMHRGGQLNLNLKCDPALAEQLRAANEQITPGYHMNKKHWNTVVPGLDEETMLAMIEDSYDLVVASLPAAERAALGWKGLVERG